MRSDGILLAKLSLKHQCCNCGNTNNIEFHHIVPITLGGQDILSNIAPICSDCHYLLHHGKNRGRKMTHSELIKEGIAKSNKTQGRKPGTLDKMTPALESDIRLFLRDRGVTQKFLMDKHHISRNTLKKYISVINSEEDKKNDIDE